MHIDPEDYDGVNEMIGAGVTYWARELTDQEWEAMRVLGIPGRHAVMALTPDADEWALVTWQDGDLDLMLSLVEDIIPGSYVTDYVRRAYVGRNHVTGYVDAAEIDSDLGDAMLQVWAFRSIQFG